MTQFICPTCNNNNVEPNRLKGIIANHKLLLASSILLTNKQILDLDLNKKDEKESLPKLQERLNRYKQELYELGVSFIWYKNTYCSVLSLQPLKVQPHEFTPEFF